MAVLRRNRSSVNIWPGFVDGLATLLMVIIFLLMIFVVAQFYLSEAITGRDQALEILNQEVAELADLLDLEQKSNIDLSSNLASLSAELQSTLTERDDFAAELTQLRTLQNTLVDSVETLQKRSERAETEGSALQIRLDEALLSIEVDKETIKVQLDQLLILQQDVTALIALRDEMEADLESVIRLEKSTAKNFMAEKEISVAAKAQVALLNRQIAALRKQMEKLNAALEGSESRDRAQKAQISDLGKRLNVALASKVQELARYRSEFFGRLREVLGDRPDIQIVGDRFIFQSEVLFESGSAEIGAEGEPQLAQLARTLIDISARIPTDINWILRIDGHTDRGRKVDEEPAANHQRRRLEFGNRGTECVAPAVGITATQLAEDLTGVGPPFTGACFGVDAQETVGRCPGPGDLEVLEVGAVYLVEGRVLGSSDVATVGRPLAIRRRSVLSHHRECAQQEDADRATRQDEAAHERYVISLRLARADRSRMSKSGRQCHRWRRDSHETNRGQCGGGDDRRVVYVRADTVDRCDGRGCGPDQAASQ